MPVNLTQPNLESPDLTQLRFELKPEPESDPLTWPLIIDFLGKPCLDIFRPPNFNFIVYFAKFEFESLVLAICNYFVLSNFYESWRMELTQDIMCICDPNPEPDELTPSLLVHTAPAQASSVTGEYLLFKLVSC